VFADSWRLRDTVIGVPVIQSGGADLLARVQVMAAREKYSQRGDHEERIDAGQKLEGGLLAKRVLRSRFVGALSYGRRPAD
jgi:hypothetical protein